MGLARSQKCVWALIVMFANKINTSSHSYNDRSQVVRLTFEIFSLEHWFARIES
jgi:hypothetical protein